MLPSLKLKPNATARVVRGHPWVFGNECEQLLPESHDGDVVECRDRTGRLLGTGIYNSKSQIVWRRLSRDRVQLDEGYIRGCVERALARRAELSGGDFCRLIWSESDDLPGVVCDRYGDTLVLQIQTLAMDRRRQMLSDVLVELSGVKEIIFRNDANIRKLEGLSSEVSTRSGKDWEPRWMKIDGLDYWLDLQGGQKTGFYLDQREQHRVVEKYAAGKRVLDAFCNQGSFALHCARAGATRVLGLDSAFDAVSRAKKNAEKNGLTAEFEGVNVFDWFTAQRDAAAAWDLIILDPPPFAKSKSTLESALRGYRELNLRAMKALMPGGVLATYTCSHHMQDEQLREVVAGAAADAKRRVRILEFCHQPSDHPVSVTMPESEYLRGYILKVE